MLRRVFPDHLITYYLLMRTNRPLDAIPSLQGAPRRRHARARAAAMPQSFVGEGSVGAVVIDLGNITTRVGFAGDDVPTAIYPSAIGAYNDAEGQWCCTVEMDSLGWAQPGLQVKRLHNANDAHDLVFQQLCEHGLQKLRVQPRDTPLLITEAATATAANRCRTTELVFETLGAPALCVARTPELAAIAAGRVTSVVLEMGAFNSTVITIALTLTLTLTLALALPEP